MSLRSTVDAMKAKTTYCKAKLIAAKMDDDDREYYLRMLDEPESFSAPTVSILVYSETGLFVGSTVIKDHRGGRCRCNR